MGRLEEGRLADLGAGRWFDATALFVAGGPGLVRRIGEGYVPRIFRELSASDFSDLLFGNGPADLLGVL